MAHRLLAFVLALTVIGAPVATDLCEAACAMRSADAASHSVGAAHHSCHAEAPSSSGPSWSALHVCGHTDQLPGVDGPEHGVATPGIMPALVVVALTSEAALVTIVPAQFTPPPRTALASPLRV